MKRSIKLSRVWLALGGRHGTDMVRVSLFAVVAGALFVAAVSPAGASNVQPDGGRSAEHTCSSPLPGTR